MLKHVDDWWRSSIAPASAVVLAVSMAVVACGGGAAPDGPGDGDPPAAADVRLLVGSAGGQGYAEGAAHESRFSQPSSIAVDANGNRYVADTGNRVIRRVAPDGTVSTLAGQLTDAGAPGTSKDGVGPAATFAHPRALVLDDSGEYLYVADSWANTIRRVRLTSGEVTTVAGSPFQTGQHAGGDGKPALLNRPNALVWTQGALLVLDSDNHAIRRLKADQELEDYVGSSGVAGSAPATTTRAEARFRSPRGLAVVSGGSELLVADTQNCVVRAVTADGVRVIAGVGGQCASIDGESTVARARFPTGVLATPDGRLLFAEAVSGLREVDAVTGAVRTVPLQSAGGAPFPAQSMRSPVPDGASGRLLFASHHTHALHALVLQGDRGLVSGFAGQARGGGQPVIAAPIAEPWDLGPGREGALLIGHVVGPATAEGGARYGGTRVAAAGSVAPIVPMEADEGSIISDRVMAAESGDGTLYSIVPLNWTYGDGKGMYRLKGWRDGQALWSIEGAPYTDGVTSSRPFQFVSALDVDPQGRAIIIDYGFAEVTRFDALGRPTRVAGSRTRYGTALGDALEQASFVAPTGLAVGPSGAIYVLDYREDLSGMRIVKIAPEGERNVVTLVVDQLRDVAGIAVDEHGQLYVANGRECIVERVRPDGRRDRVVGQPGRCTYVPTTRQHSAIAAPRAIRVRDGRLRILMDDGVVEVSNLLP